MSKTQRYGRMVINAHGRKIYHHKIIETSFEQLAFIIRVAISIVNTNIFFTEYKIISACLKKDRNSAICTK